ncbi:NAD(P)-dependent oxidoreductase [Brucella sp. 21LCYQ03]|nr:NAD(P)-dependent oxidoreductase [Brucella sp. 21LCYQ03]
MTGQKNRITKGESVLVTGAAGLLGTYVTGAFEAAGYEVLGVDIAQRGNLNVVIADLTQLDVALEVIRDVDHVVHIASLPRPVGFAAQDVYHTNMSLMFNVVEAMERNEINSLIYASSFSTIGLPFGNKPPLPDYFPIDAHHSTRALDIYALTKLLGEHIVDYWVARTHGNAVSIRMPWIQDATIFARDVLCRRDTEDAKLDLWAYVDGRDAARAFVLSVQANLMGHSRFFISANDSYSEHPTAELLKEFYPTVPVKEPINDFQSLLSNKEAKMLIGFEPHHSWREYGPFKQGKPL